MRTSAFGYMGKLRALKACIGYILRMLGWSYTLSEIFMGDADEMVQGISCCGLSWPGHMWPWRRRPSQIIGQALDSIACPKSLGGTLFSVVASARTIRT